jgi:hypothetical protein
MGQKAPPNADVAVGTWTPNNPIYSNINSLKFQSDATYVATSNPLGDAFTVGLRPIAFPDANGQQILLVRAQGQSDLSMSALLLLNGAIVATRSAPLTIAAHILIAQQTHGRGPFTHDPAGAIARRRIACPPPRGGCPRPGDPPAHISCDDYPFASSSSGGLGASTACVPLVEQQIQGGYRDGGWVDSGEAVMR